MIADLLAEADRQQRAAIDYRGGNAYVGAGPGTGKTYLLIERYRALRASGVPSDKILILTFSRRAVIDLQERLASAGILATEAEVRTFHGFAARVLGAGQPSFRDRRLLDGFSRQVLLETAIERTTTPALSSGVRASRAFRTEIGRLLDDFGRVSPAVFNAIDPQASPRLRDVLGIHRYATAARSTIGGSDLGDLVSRAVNSAREPDSAVARWLNGRYTHVLVDEFQDSDRVQLDLLACLNAVIFAVGDEAQSIYRFRGASDDIVAAARKRFQMERFDLTVSRRCPPDVCAVASRTPIPDLSPLLSAKPSGPDVQVVRLRAVDDEVAYLADAIEADVNAGLPLSEIAVLFRAFRPLGPLLVDELRRRGIAVTSTGREELLADPRVATLRAALDVLDNPSDANRWMRLLTAPTLWMNPVAIRFASPQIAQLRLDDSLPRTLEPLCEGGALSAARLADALLHAADAWRADALGSAARRLVRRLGLLRSVLLEEPPSHVRHVGSRLKLLCDALAAAQRTARTLLAPATCSDILARFEEYLPSLALDDAGLDLHSQGVRVLTVHAAKGLEFERVFIADAVQGRFPQDARASTLLSEGDREVLLRHGVDGPSVVPDGLAKEEASLWFVAVTRCKSRLTITFADRGLNGDPQRPSRFIELARTPEKIHAVDRESLLVRALREADNETRDRILASGSLADVPATQDSARSGIDAFVPFDGLALQRTGNLSVGDAELWLQCPRKLFYKKFARLPDEESTALTLGSAIHDVLNRFHGVRASFDPADIDVELWQRELLQLREQSWRTDEFQSTVIADAAARAADAALRGYARALGTYAGAQPFRVALREEKIEVPAGAFRLVGKIDRLDEYANGARVVIDYKSGTARNVTLTKAAEKVAKDWSEADDAGVPRKALARRLEGNFKLQLALYATAFEAVSSVGYMYLGGVNNTPKRNGAFLEMSPFAGALRDVTTEALLEIETGLLEPLARGTLLSLPVTFNEEACTFCSYVHVCPGPDEDLE